jgi:hypothetical protein
MFTTCHTIPRNTNWGCSETISLVSGITVLASAGALMVLFALTTTPLSNTWSTAVLYGDAALGGLALLAFAVSCCKKGCNYYQGQKEEEKKEEFKSTNLQKTFKETFIEGVDPHLFSDLKNGYFYCMHMTPPRNPKINNFIVFKNKSGKLFCSELLDNQKLANSIYELKIAGFKSKNDEKLFHELFDNHFPNLGLKQEDYKDLKKGAFDIRRFGRDDYFIVVRTPEGELKSTQKMPSAKIFGYKILLGDLGYKPKAF